PAPRLVTLKVVEPGKRQGGVKVKTVQELIEKLKTEAKVI
ncbi:MAG: electron transfer flavoprotein subunit beta/FixA family protein, partial [Alphaproteobacteria bacterium]